MAVTIIATAKSATANSYITLSDANTYADGMLDATTWDAASTDDRNRALKTATDILETFDYVSAVTSSTQRLKWPRLGVTDADGRDFDQDTVPRFIEEATVELAVRLIDGSYTPADTGLEAFERVKVDVLEVVPNNARRAAVLPEYVRRLLRPYLAGGGAYTARLVKA